MFETIHTDQLGEPVIALDGKPMMGTINHILWSDVFVCPNCSNEFAFWDVAVDQKACKVRNAFSCPYCNSLLKKGDCSHARNSEYDSLVGEVISPIKMVPVQINYSVGGKRYEKQPDETDLEKIEQAKALGFEYWVPCSRMPEGRESRRNDQIGITHVHHFYLKSSLVEMAYIWDYARNIKDKAVGHHLMFAHSAANQYLSKMRRFRPDKKGGGPLSGTLYISSLITPPNPVLSIRRNAKRGCEKTP